MSGVIMLVCNRSTYDDVLPRTTFALIEEKSVLE